MSQPLLQASILLQAATTTSPSPPPPTRRLPAKMGERRRPVSASRLARSVFLLSVLVSVWWVATRQAGDAPASPGAAPLASPFTGLAQYDVETPFKVLPGLVCVLHALLR